MAKELMASGDPIIYSVVTPIYSDWSEPPRSYRFLGYMESSGRTRQARGTGAQCDNKLTRVYLFPDWNRKPYGRRTIVNILQN